MNRRPDRSANWTLRSCATGNVVQFIEPCHVIDRNFHLQGKLLPLAGVDDRHRAKDLSSEV